MIRRSNLTRVPLILSREYQNLRHIISGNSICLNLDVFESRPKLILKNIGKLINVFKFMKLFIAERRGGETYVTLYVKKIYLSIPIRKIRKALAICDDKAIDLIILSKQFNYVDHQS